jgi:hypothetical protein
MQFAICNFILIFDFDLIFLFRPISTRFAYFDIYQQFFAFSAI